MSLLKMHMNQKSHKFDILLAILPFIIFWHIISKYPFTFFDFIIEGGLHLKILWGGGYYKIAFIIFILLTVFLFYLKEYKFKSKYVWMIFSLYFISICFSPDLLFKILIGIDESIQSSVTDDFNISLGIDRFHYILFLLNVILIVFLRYVLKFKVDLLWICLFIYHYIYCYLSFQSFVYYLGFLRTYPPTISVVIGANWYYITFVIVLNISMMFLIITYLFNSERRKKIAVMLYLVGNIISLCLWPIILGRGFYLVLLSYFNVFFMRPNMFFYFLVIYFLNRINERRIGEEQ